MADETRVRTRKRGLKNIHLALVTANNATTYTAGIPIKLGTAITAKISDKFETSKEYGDDAIEEVISQYIGSELEIELNALAPQDRRDLLGNLYANGFLVRGSEDEAPEVAIGWCSKKKDGKYEFTWYYCGKFSDGFDESYETQGEKVKTQTNTLKGQFYSRMKEDTITGKKKHLFAINVDEANLLETETDAKTAITTWFTAVPEYKAVVIP